MDHAPARRWTVAVAVLSALPAAAAHAWSLGASLAVADVQPHCDRVDVGNCGSELGVRLYAGHDWTEHVRFELSWLEHGRRSDFVDAIADNRKFEVDIDGPAISVLPMVEVTESITLFGVAGLFRWDLSGFAEEFDAASGTWVRTAELDERGTDPYLGIGARFAFGNGALRLEWEQYEVDDEEMPAASIGYEYMFR